MTWVVIVWCLLILGWAIGGAASNDCGSQKGSDFLSASDAQDACAAGTGIGVAAIILLGFFGFVFLSLIWFMTRPKGRECPRCGENVKKGVMTCKACAFDFQTVGARPAETASPPTGVA
jgi:TM2 domain-containing membrane protein YozV